MGYRKTIITAFLALLTAQAVWADGWESRSEYRRFGPPPHRHERHHWRGSDWVAPLVVLGVTGAAIAAVTSRPNPLPPVLLAPPPPLPEPVYVYPSTTAVPVLPQGSAYAVPPQVTVTAPSGVAYYCPTYGQYHPQVQACPSGWQLVAVPH